MNFEVLNTFFNGSADNLCEFYRNLSGIDELLSFCEWRRSRAGRVNTFIYNPDIQSKVVTVVLTPKIEDDFAIGCRKIFSLSPIVFTYGTSPYFNEPFYWNAGIKRALELNPDWVVLSTDDMYEVDSFSQLLRQLDSIDNKVFDNVWINPEPDYYHSYPAYLSSRLIFERMYRVLRSSNQRSMNQFYNKFKIDRVVLPNQPTRKPFRYWLFHKLFPPLVYSKSLQFMMTSDFSIISSEFIRRQPEEKLLKEIFPRQADTDLSLRLYHAKSASVDFRIGSCVGGHYPPGMKKALHEIVDITLFNQMLRDNKYSGFLKS